MNKDFSQIFSTPPRVLIVDNNEGTANIYKDLLELWDYQPFVAKGNGQALLQDAIEKANSQRCQLALVDLRLIDDLDDEDTSGLELAKLIKPTATIIITGYGTIQLAVENIQNKTVASFIIKGGSPESIFGEIKKVAIKICAKERGLKIGPSEIVLSLAETLFEENVTISARDQLLDTLARLFPEADNLRLVKLDPAPSTSGFAEVPRPRSVILKIWEDDFQPVIVKLARVPKIEKEVERYKTYIHKRLGNLSAPDFEKFETLWDIGGIKFSYSGNIEKTFEQFYKSQPPEVINTTLGRFFSQSWSDHFKNAQLTENIALIQLYREVLEENWIKRVERFTPPNPEEIMGHALWKMLDASEPVSWFRKKILSEPDGMVGRVAQTFIAVTHGDLHAGNLLIDDSNNAWVIDFERTGEGHILQDFIELESDLINRMVPGSEKFPHYHRLCFAVTAPQEIGSIQNDFGLADPSSTKLLQTISTIRSFARDCSGLADIHQYLIGLFFNTLFRATIIKDISNPGEQKSQERALMLASIICHRLDHWEVSWPPENWLQL